MSRGLPGTLILPRWPQILDNKAGVIMNGKPLDCKPARDRPGAKHLERIHKVCDASCTCPSRVPGGGKGASLSADLYSARSGILQRITS